MGTLDLDPTQFGGMSKRAHYRVASPDTTTLAELEHEAGSCWKIEEGVEAVKGEVELDQYEVRCFGTLALLPPAILVVLWEKANAREKKRSRGGTQAAECGGKVSSDPNAMGVRRTT